VFRFIISYCHIHILLPNLNQQKQISILFPYKKSSNILNINKDNFSFYYRKTNLKNHRNKNVFEKHQYKSIIFVYNYKGQGDVLFCKISKEMENIISKNSRDAISPINTPTALTTVKRTSLIFASDI